MFEVPNSVPHSRPWRLALLWLGVALASSALRWGLYARIFQIIPQSVSGRWIIDAVDLVFLFVPVLAQWLVLRRFFPGMRRWVALHGGVLFAQALLNRPVYRLIERILLEEGRLTTWSNREMLVSLLGLLFWALMLGIAGWIIFRAVVQRPRLWLWATLAGALIQWLVFSMLPPLDIEYGVLDVIYDLVDYGSPLLTAALQAAVLVSFLRERQQPAVPATA